MDEFSEIDRLCQEIAERDVRIHDLTQRVLELRADLDEAVGLLDDVVWDTQPSRASEAAHALVVRHHQREGSDA